MGMILVKVIFILTKEGLKISKILHKQLGEVRCISKREFFNPTILTNLGYTIINRTFIFSGKSILKGAVM